MLDSYSAPNPLSVPFPHPFPASTPPAADLRLSQAAGVPRLPTALELVVTEVCLPLTCDARLAGSLQRRAQLPGRHASFLTAAGMRPCLSGGPGKPTEYAPSLVGDINIFQHAGNNLIGAFPRVPSSKLGAAEAKRKKKFLLPMKSGSFLH